MRVLSLKRGRAERLSPGVGPADGGFGFDLLDQCGDAFPLGSRGEMLPAGQGGERHGLGRGVLQPVEALSLPASGVLSGAIEPEALQPFAVEQAADGVNARPVAELRDEVLFDAMGEHVAQAVDLGGLFGADDDCLVAPGPDLLPPGWN